MNNMILDNTWELNCIMDARNRALKNKNFEIEHQNQYDKKEQIEELYAQNIRLQCQERIGYVMTAQDFKEHVKNGSFMDFDGSGEWMDWEGNKLNDPLSCDLKLLKKYKHPFVVWYNK